MSSTSKSSPPADAGEAGQILAGAGAALALLGPFGIALSAIGVALMVTGVIVSAPYASDPGPYLAEWWNVIGGATLVCLVGFGLWFLLPVAGSVLLAVGAVVALVGVSLGFRVPQRG